MLYIQNITLALNADASFPFSSVRSRCVVVRTFQNPFDPPKGRARPVNREKYWIPMMMGFDKGITLLTLRCPSHETRDEFHLQMSFILGRVLSQISSKGPPKSEELY